MTIPTAEILTIGTELLVHGKPDTNSAELCELFTREGFSVSRRLTVGDDLQTLTEAFRESAARAQLVVSTGGLGPTADDRTRQAVSAAFGAALEERAELLVELEAKYRAVQLAMPASNRQQALIPEGARALSNPVGSAPGIFLEHDAGLVVVLPGPPGEMRAVLNEEVMNLLRRRFAPPAVAFGVVRTAGMGESAIEDRIAEIYDLEPDTELTVLASPGEVELRVLARHPESSVAARRAANVVEKIARILGPAVYDQGGGSLAETVGRRLRQSGLTIAVAESCTAGLLGAALTGPPGASAYFLGGVIAYSNAIKRSVLGVPEELLQRHGAVSEESARAMAEGVRRQFQSDLSLAVTGIAGPEGGTAEKPVGLVFLALASASGIECRRLQFPGDRNWVRRWSAARSLDLLRRHLERVESMER